MSTTMPPATCERPHTEWRRPCGANLRPRSGGPPDRLGHVVGGPRQQDALRRVVHEVPEVVGVRVRVASSKRSSPSSGGGAVVAGIGRLLRSIGDQQWVCNGAARAPPRPSQIPG